ncbi:MAG: EamA family transporter [Treponema sp.]|nr:EamA family transporter [Treponema sp.]
MPKFKNIALFLFMHAGFLLYSFYTVLGKFASAYNFLSIEWILFYCGLLLIIFIYAILWQQVLKHIELSVATANKAATIIWGMFWSSLFFKEEITIKKIIGALIVLAGIILLSTTKTQSEKNK